MPLPYLPDPSSNEFETKLVENSNARLITNFPTNKDSEEWHSKRKHFICSSEAGAVLGLDPHLSRKRLLELKSGAKRPRKESEYGQRCLDWGKEHESVALRCLEKSFPEIMGHIEAIGSLQHKDVPAFCGQPDGVVRNEGGKYVPIEIKCRYYPDPVRAVPFCSVEEIPPKNLVQIQCYMELLDMDLGYLVSWSLNNGITVFQCRRTKKLFRDFLFPVIQKWVSGTLPLRMRHEEKSRAKEFMSKTAREKTRVFAKFSSCNF